MADVKEQAQTIAVAPSNPGWWTLDLTLSSSSHRSSVCPSFCGAGPPACSAPGSSSTRTPVSARQLSHTWSYKRRVTWLEGTACHAGHGVESRATSQSNAASPGAALADTADYCVMILVRRVLTARICS